ncbi:hypothetical protein D770_10520 [Flammeovirgaceae bacterium 311]|nr:hypothetical protein D770_10520 [Flammeovirgaceae bacterium 311]
MLNLSSKAGAKYIFNSQSSSVSCESVLTLPGNKIAALLSARRAGNYLIINTQCYQSKSNQRHPGAHKLITMSLVQPSGSRPC